MIILDIRLPGESHRLEIQNDCTGDSETGNYNVQLFQTYPREKGSIRRVHVSGHRRAAEAAAGDQARG